MDNGFTQSLNNDQRCVLALIRRSFDIPVEAAAPDNCTAAARMISVNGILLTVYPAVKSLGEAFLPLESILRRPYLALVTQAVRQNYEGGRILEGLSRAGLDCIGLKGWQMRQFYPNPMMRQMVDLDVLVRPYDFAAIGQVMADLGFNGEGGESNWKHDNFRKNEINVEIHKRLTDDSAAVQKWEGEMWSRVIRTDEHVCRMSMEDYVIFHFVHLHKDFLNGSLGLRRIIDTWLLQKERYDREAVLREMDGMGMKLFYQKMIHLSRACMGEEELDSGSVLLLNHAFTHGIYGSGKSYKAGRIAVFSRSGGLAAGKLRSKLAAVFLPYSRMKAQYPVLVRRPYLLPYCWAKRIIRYLRSDKGRYRHMLDYSGISKADYDEMKAFFQAGGIQ